MNFDTNQPSWSENVILVDGDYADKVAFNLIVNFERMIGRRIPKADTARWIDCIALDGGLREGANSVQVVFVHDRAKAAMDNFTPGNYASELDGKAFGDHLGEFLISSVEADGPEKVADLFAESAYWPRRAASGASCLSPTSRNTTTACATPCAMPTTRSASRCSPWSPWPAETSAKRYSDTRS